MITLYLIFKLTDLLVSLCVWMLLLPFKLIALPFRLLFGKPSKKQVNREDEAFWNGFIAGSIFF